MSNKCFPNENPLGEESGSVPVFVYSKHTSNQLNDNARFTVMWPPKCTITAPFLCTSGVIWVALLTVTLDFFTNFWSKFSNHVIIQTTLMRGCKYLYLSIIKICYDGYSWPFYEVFKGKTTRIAFGFTCKKKWVNSFVIQRVVEITGY